MCSPSVPKLFGRLEAHCWISLIWLARWKNSKSRSQFSANWSKRTLIVWIGSCAGRELLSVGEVYWQRGDLEAASAEFLSQLSVVDALAAAQPENAERLEHSGYAWTNFGRVMELGGQYDEALQAYQTVMEVFQRLLALQPESIDTRLELGFCT